MLKMKKCNPGLLWVVFFLVLRDVAVGLKQPVFFLLLLILLIPMFVLVCDTIKRKLSCKSLWFLGILTIFYAVIASINDAGLKYLLPMIYAGYAFRNIDYKQIGKVFVIAQLLMILIRISLVQLGIITEELVTLDYKSEAGQLYHDLGYGNPNSAGMVFFFFIISLHLVMYKKYKWISFFLILIISLFSFGYTASRTSLLASILVLLTYIVPSYIMNKVFYNRLFLFCVPILILFPIVLGDWILANHEEINELLSNRVYLAYALMGLFESPISFLTGVIIEEDGIPIDNAFCYMLINYGIISIIVFIIKYAAIIKRRYVIPLFVLSSLVIIIISGLGEASWAAFGGIGASFFWILLLNNTYYKIIFLSKRSYNYFFKNQKK